MSEVVNYDSLLNRRIGPPPLTSAVTSWNGLTGDVKGTLAEIYAFGLGDNSTADNVFAMSTGNRRWAISPAGGAFDTISDAFFESSPPLGDSRVGVWAARRQVNAFTTGATFLTASLYNETDVGNPLPDGRTWITWRGQSAIDLLETGFNGNLSWLEKYDANNFFNGQPVSIPTADPAVGGRITKSEALYANALSGPGAFFARDLTGWGQEDLYTLPQSAGITPSFLGWYNTGQIADAAGNGVGVFFGAGDPSHNRPDRLRGGLDCHMLGANYLGDWGSRIWAYDSSGPSLVQVAEFDPHAITFNVPVFGADVGTGSSGLLDLTTVADNIPMTIPVRAGYYFCPFQARLFLRDTTGAAIAGTLSISYGNNATHDNGGASAISVASFNTLAGQKPAYVTLGTGSAASPELVDAGTAFNVKISAVLTGVATAHGRIAVLGFWYPV
jgi:hypothetical protein